MEKSHSRLIEEIAAAIESERRNAVDKAIAAEREIAKAELSIVRENADRELRLERENSKKQLDATLEKAKKELISERENATTQLNAERESAKREQEAERASASEQLKAQLQKFEIERESAKNQLNAERESAKNQLNAERESAKTQLNAERESAKDQLKAEREKFEKELQNAANRLNAEREKAANQIETERENANNQLNSERESAKNQISAERDRAARELNAARAELAETASRSKAAGRQSTAEALNQSLRRIRQAASVDAALQLTAELSGEYAHKAVVLVFENNQARVAAGRGAAGVNGAGPLSGAREAFDLTLENAPALASAIETRDPVTVLAREAEISPALVRLLAAGPADKVYLFPVIARHQVVAMLVVAGEVFPPAPELLAEAAGMRLESITGAPKEVQPVESLINIQRAAVPTSEAADRRSWDDLSAEDQQLHLQAQRVARVRVAKMRLDREDAWRRGLAQSDVYGALRREIESARTEFLQTFLSKSSTMVDYLHLEILRNLANEDTRLLGREYPGPMV